MRGHKSRAPRTIRSLPRSSPVAQPGALPVTRSRSVWLVGPAFPRVEEPVRAGFWLAPTGACDESDDREPAPA